jgi:hypothetical protein
VVKRAVNECKSVPRLLYFTEGFQRGSKHTSLHISNGALISLTEQEDEEAEHQLTKSEVLEALTNWLTLLQDKEPEGVQMWKDVLNEHLLTMQKDPHSWEEQLEYIILLRSNCTPFTDRIPSWDWAYGWTLAVNRSNHRKDEARNRTDSELQSQVHQLQSQLQSQTSFRSQQPSHLGYHNNDQALAKRVPGQTSKGGAAAPKTGTTSKPGKDLFCIVCAAKGDHSFRQCKAPVQANGNPLRLTPLEGGHWKWIGSNLGVCYNWNGRHSCPNPHPCKNGTHACSLCQEPSHGASACPTI